MHYRFFLQLLGLTAILFVTSLWQAAMAADPSLRISNRLKSDQHINIERGELALSVIPASAQSSYWILEPVAGTDFIMLRNNWGKDQLINIEEGSLQSSVIHTGAYSAHWFREPVAGTRFVRLRNRWKPDQYIHVQGPTIAAGRLSPAAHIGHWLLGTGQPATTTAEAVPAPSTEKDRQLSLASPSGETLVSQNTGPNVPSTSLFKPWNRDAEQVVGGCIARTVQRQRSRFCVLQPATI